MRVCFKWKLNRGRVSGREIMWVVSGDGTVWVRQAREKVMALVGVNERISYEEK